MPKWAFTATSRTGQPINPITGDPSDTITVYDQADLDQRTKAAETDPRQLDVTIRPIS